MCMLNKRIIADILGVKHTIIESFNSIDNKGDIVINVRPTKGQQLRCPICNRKSDFYDKGRGMRLWRNCDWNNRLVYLASYAPRINCKKHGVLVAKVPWARHNSGFTYEFEQVVAYKALSCSKTAVSNEMRISWESVGNIISRVRKSVDPNPKSRLDGLVRIGVDETSYRKGHKYLTVIVNHDTGKAIWVSAGYGSDILSSFFEQLTPEQRASIKYVTADGARWISSCIEEYCPGAIRCMDSFHVVEWATEALDKVRKEAWRDARSNATPKPKRKRGRPSADAPKMLPSEADHLKGVKYALGKAPENLTYNQQTRLAMLAISDKRLYRAYLWKEGLRLILHASYEEAAEVLDSWIKGVKHCRIPEFLDLGKKIERHRDAILATVKYGLSNARIEAINNKIKLTIRMAYGFKNIENMLDMIMLRCSDIKIPLPWEELIAA